MISSSVCRIIGNAIAILTSDVVNRATTFVLYILVGRHLGAFEFGQMSLALSLFYTFQMFAVAGLRTFITREISKDETKTDQYLVNGSMVVVVCSLLSISILFLFIQAMDYAASTAFVILLLSLGLLPYSLSAICEAVFQGREKMQYIAYANIPMNVIKVGVTFFLLLSGYRLYHLIVLLLAYHVAVMSLEWFFMLQRITKPRLKIDLHFSSAMIKSSITFLGIDGTLAIMTSLHVVVLSTLTSETEVGLYSAANQLMVPVALIYQNIALSVFPVMCKRFDSSFQSLKQISEHLLELLLIVALPSAVGLYFLADSVLLWIYGKEEFLLASGVLRIMAWSLLPIAFTNVLGQVLIASLRERVTLRIVVIDLIAGLVFSLVFISQFGLIGAAIAAILTKMVDFIQHYIPVARLFSKISLGHLLWKPVVASVCMIIYLAAMREQDVLLIIISAGILYIGIFFALAIWSSGGPRQFKAKYLSFQSE